ncbi:MAG: hypothetical protein UW56_C0018G0001 [Candidatus Collierbacteria bacterium GW2011_GWD1_44_27]|nr:MAG: hypothetical protein UW56_C0018G0001 [Candidatus Collierbacteria bacterium GW2011_GWD1_44_27]
MIYVIVLFNIYYPCYSNYWTRDLVLSIQHNYFFLRFRSRACVSALAETDFIGFDFDLRRSLDAFSATLGEVFSFFAID